MASQAPPALGPVPLPVAEAEADRAKKTKRNFIFGFLSEDSKVAGENICRESVFYRNGGLIVINAKGCLALGNKVNHATKNCKHDEQQYRPQKSSQCKRKEKAELF